MEDEGNFSSKAKGIVTIVVIALICLIAYFVYDVFFKTTRSISINSTVVIDSMKLIEAKNSLRNVTEIPDTFYTDLIVNSSNLTDKDKSWIVYNHISNKLSKLVYTCSILNGYDNALYNTCNSYGTDLTYVETAQKLSYDNFQTEYQKIFGNNTSVPISGFSALGVKGYYSAQNNDFLILSFAGVGGYDDHFSLNMLKDATIYPDKLEVEQYYALCSIGSDSTGLKCMAGTKTVKEDSKTTSRSGLDITTFGRLYKFTFNKNADGSYYWYSTEPVEK